MPRRSTTKLGILSFILMGVIATLLVTACSDSTAPYEPSSKMQMPAQLGPALDLEECGVTITCEECIVSPTESCDGSPPNPCYPGTCEVCTPPAACDPFQEVAFTSAPPDPAYAGGTYTPSASATWDALGFTAVITTLTPSICSMSGGLVSFVAAGTCILAADQPGNGDMLYPAPQVTQSFSVTVLSWPFTGFLSPLSNSPKANSANAGSVLPVKFGLGGNRGLDILAAGFPASSAIACPNGTSSAEVPARAAGGSRLSYDALTGIYTYAWATEKSWAGTCRRLVVQLTDGSSHSTTVAFR